MFAIYRRGNKNVTNRGIICHTAEISAVIIQYVCDYNMFATYEE